MAALGKKLRTIENGLMFYCPACNTPHAIRLGHNGWQWNENIDHPTFMPSLMSAMSDVRCHLFVQEGQLRYLTDSTHELAGKIVPIPDWPFPDHDNA